MAMLRTLAVEGHDADVAFVHYARNPAEACCRDELTTMPGPPIWPPPCRPRTRCSSAAQSLWSTPVRAHCSNVVAESFVTPKVASAAASAAEPAGARATFAESGVAVTDDGRSLLEQAERAGLSPPSGCRMGICHTCTRRKISGAVRNLSTGAVSVGAGEIAL